MAHSTGGDGSHCGILGLQSSRALTPNQTHRRRHTATVEALRVKLKGQAHNERQPAQSSRAGRNFVQCVETAMLQQLSDSTTKSLRVTVPALARSAHGQRPHQPQATQVPLYAEMSSVRPVLVALLLRE